MALVVQSRDFPSYSKHTRVHWRTFFIRGKSRTPESRMEIEESRSRWEFWREVTQPVREAIVLFSGGFDILDDFPYFGGVGLFTSRISSAKTVIGCECKKAFLILRYYQLKEVRTHAISCLFNTLHLAINFLHLVFLAANSNPNPSASHNFTSSPLNFNPTAHSINTLRTMSLLTKIFGRKWPAPVG